MRHAVVLMILCVGCASAPATAPVVSEGFVLRPLFQTVDGELAAGTAFVAEIPGSGARVLLSALHLFGENGGLDREIPPDELPAYVSGVHLAAAFDGSPVGTAEGPIEIPDASPMNEKPGVGDIVAFRLAPEASLPAAPLAASNPAVGDTIWLAAEVSGVADRHLFAAKVVEIDRADLIFIYEDPSLDLRATSGAALLNAAGEVVGINVGGGNDDGILFGFANSVDNFRGRLLNAIER